MSFANPNILLHLFWLIPGTLLLSWWGEVRRRRKLAMWVEDPDLAADLTVTVCRSRRRWRLFLIICMVTLVLVSLARPQWGTHLVRSPSRSRDVMVVVDTSRSMLARDISPSRLDHAKFLIRRLIGNFPGDRFGLVLFAGDAFCECPLTQNRSGFLLSLDNASTDSIPVGGTNLERALTVAMNSFEGAEGTHRGVLLITDGDELQGDTAEILASYRENDIPIFVVGIGDPILGTFIQVEGNKFVMDEDGSRVNTKLNEQGLQTISKAVNGTYVRSSVTYDGTDHLSQKIHGLIPEDKQEDSSIRPIERYQIPLLLALLLGVIRLFLGERRTATSHAHDLDTPWTRSAALVLVAMAFFSSVPNSHSQQANPPPSPGLVVEDPLSPELEEAQRIKQQRQQALADQIESLESSLEAATTDIERAFYQYNLGVTSHHAGDLERATKAYQKAIDLAIDQPELRGRAFQNLGAIRHQEGLAKLQSSPDDAIESIDQARENYREAMRLTKDPMPIAKDQELAIRHQEIARQIKKMQEEMQQQQQDMKDAVEESLEEQKKANEASDPQQKQESQEKSMEANKKAQESLEEMSNQARDQGQEMAADQLDKMKEQLEQVEEKQKETMNRHRSEEEKQEAGKEAEEQLSQIQQQLEGEEKEQDQEGGDKADQPPEDDSQEEADDQSDEGGDESDEPPESSEDEESGAGSAGEEDEQSEFDKQQALRILEQMERQGGGDLMKELKKGMSKGQNNRPTKDW